MMRSDGILAEQFGQVPRHAFGHAPSVDEYERGAMLRDQFGESRIDLRPHVAGHHRRQRRGRQFDSQVALARMADVDDFADIFRAGEESRHFRDGFLRR